MSLETTNSWLPRRSAPPVSASRGAHRGARRVRAESDDSRGRFPASVNRKSASSRPGYGSRASPKAPFRNRTSGCRTPRRWQGPALPVDARSAATRPSAWSGRSIVLIPPRERPASRRPGAVLVLSARLDRPAPHRRGDMLPVRGRGSSRELNTDETESEDETRRRTVPRRARGGTDPCSRVPGAAAKRKDKQEAESEPAGLTVERWLVLGPVAHPLPVFHDAEKGGYDLKKLLDETILPARTLRPRDGASVDWFAGAAPAWTVANAGKEGRVGLEPPDGDGPALAWTATWLSVDRWSAFDLILAGGHPRRAWLDGRPLASGGNRRPTRGQGPDRTDHGQASRCSSRRSSIPSATRTGPSGATLRAEGEEPVPDAGGQLDPARPVSLGDILDAPRDHVAGRLARRQQGGGHVRRVVPGTDDTESWVEIRRTTDGAPVESWRGGARRHEGRLEPRRPLRLLRRRRRRVTRAGLDPLPVRRGRPAGPCRCWRRSSGWAATLVSRREGDRLLDHREGREGRAGGQAGAGPGGPLGHLPGQAVPTPRQRARRRPAPADRRRADDLGRGLLARRRPIAVHAQRRAARRSGPTRAPSCGRLDLRSFDATKLRDFLWFSDGAYSPDGKRHPGRRRRHGVRRRGRGSARGRDSQQLRRPAVPVGPGHGRRRADHPRLRSLGHERALESRRTGWIYSPRRTATRARFYRYDPAARAFASAGDRRSSGSRRLDLAERAPVAAVCWAVRPGSRSGWSPSTWPRMRPGPCAHPSATGSPTSGRAAMEEWSFDALPAAARSPAGSTCRQGFDPSRKYPAIVYYYGGTSPVTREFGGRYPKEWWAANGYVVYVLQPSGATGFGQDWSAAHVNDWGKITHAGDHRGHPAVPRGPSVRGPGARRLHRRLLRRLHDDAALDADRHLRRGGLPRGDLVTVVVLGRGVLGRAVQRGGHAPSRSPGIARTSTSIRARCSARTGIECRSC